MLAKCVIVLAVATVTFGTPLKNFNRSLIPGGGKIVGGVEAVEGEIPWQVSIQTVDGDQSCGGTIISEDWVATAAHCSDIRPDKYRIRAGTLFYGSGGSMHTISEIIIHSNFESNTFFNDIALWKVNPPFAYDSTTAAAALPAQGTDTPADTLVTVSGWGDTLWGGSISPELRKVDMPIVSKEDCKTAYLTLRPNQICAGVPEGGLDSCQGDSGGPLFKDGALIGIVSYGYNCAEPGYPGVYTEVSAYRDWISINVGV